MTTPFFNKFILSGLLGLLSFQAYGQDAYPSKPITLVVPFTPGSGSDIVARIVSKGLSDALHAVVVVENRPGANGAIGAQYVARAKPDGYTLLLGSATSNAVNYFFSASKLGYSPSSFDFIGGLNITNVSLYTASTQSWRNVNDIVEFAKKNPGQISCGSGNAVTQVACEYFKKKAGVDLVTVTYKSNAQSLTDVTGRQVSIAFSDATAAQVYVAGGKIRSIASAGSKRNPVDMETPTMTEQGIPDFDFNAWSAVFSPAGVPHNVAEKLNSAIINISASPEMLQLREKNGGIPMNMNLQSGKIFVVREISQWKKYIEQSGIK